MEDSEFKKFIEFDPDGRAFRLTQPRSLEQQNS
jgi:hypothetical protein